MKVGVYLIINKIDNKKIVGSVYECSFSTRRRNYFNPLKSGKYCNPYLQLAWNKYQNQQEKLFKWNDWDGKNIVDVFEFRELEVYNKKDVTEEYVLNREDFWMEHFQTKDPRFGYNLKSASHPIKFTKEVKDEMSKNRKGEKSYWYGKHLSEETKQKLSKAMKGKLIGEKNPFFGKLKGEDNPMFGKKHSEMTKKKISLANRGRKFTEETLKKRSENAKGSNNPNSKLTQKQVDEIREKYETGKYYQYELSIEYSISKSQISYILNKGWNNEDEKC